MIKKLEQLKLVAQQKIEELQEIHELNEIKAFFLGKKSTLQEIMAQMRDFTIEEKKEIGQKANEFRTFIEEIINEKRGIIENRLILRKLNDEAIDVTLPGKDFSDGHIHPLTMIKEEIEDIFIGMGYEIAEGPEIEEDLYNFEMLNLPSDHPARDMQDSFYINTKLLLRTHTSPVQARTMIEKKNQPIKIICPGKVYRRDEDDATHSHQFMQIEGLVIDKDITMSDLKGTLSFLMQKMFGSRLAIRFRPSYFPFTEPSVEVDVTCFKCNGKGCPLCKGNGWIEILGAGMVHPNVLEMAGYDSAKWQGFAFGLGIERVAMLRYGIDDIRNFYINNYRFLKQF